MSGECPVYIQHRTFPDAIGTSQLGRLGYRGGGQPLWAL